MQLRQLPVNLLQTDCVAEKKERSPDRFREKIRGLS